MNKNEVKLDLEYNFGGDESQQLFGGDESQQLFGDDESQRLIQNLVNSQPVQQNSDNSQQAVGGELQDYSTMSQSAIEPPPKKRYIKKMNKENSHEEGYENDQDQGQQVQQVQPKRKYTRSATAGKKSGGKELPQMQDGEVFRQRLRESRRVISCAPPVLYNYPNDCIDLGGGYDIYIDVFHITKSGKLSGMNGEFIESSPMIHLRKLNPKTMKHFTQFIPIRYCSSFAQGFTIMQNMIDRARDEYSKLREEYATGKELSARKIDQVVIKKEDPVIKMDDEKEDPGFQQFCNEVDETFNSIRKDIEDTPEYRQQRFAELKKLRQEGGEHLFTKEFEELMEEIRKDMEFQKSEENRRKAEKEIEELMEGIRKETEEQKAISNSKALGYGKGKDMKKLLELKRQEEEEERSKNQK